MSDKSAGTRFIWDNRQIAEATRVHAEFCNLQLDRQTDAYTGRVDEFGGPGNVVDSWRREFTRNESRFRSAGGRVQQKRKASV
jgi:hypothetical protein